MRDLMFLRGWICGNSEKLFLLTGRLFFSVWVCGLLFNVLEARAAERQHLSAAKMRSYCDLAITFNQTVSGRFPFVNDEGLDRAEDAQYQAVVAIYQRLDRLMEAGGVDLLSKQVQAFIGALNDVRGFVLLSEGKKEGSSEGLVYQVTFDTAPALSVGNAQVVRWALSSGVEMLHYPNGATLGTWHRGKPMTVGFTWAEQSMWRPSTSAALNSHEVEFRFNGQWSLLHLLRKSAVSIRPDKASTEDRQAYNLRFVIPLEAKGQESKKMLAELYIRLKFIQSNLNLSVIKPPTRAPSCPMGSM